MVMGTEVIAVPRVVSAEPRWGKNATIQGEGTSHFMSDMIRQEEG